MMLNALTNSDFWVYFLLSVFYGQICWFYFISCHAAFYLLSQLKNEGLSINVLNILFHALIVSRITYALPALLGFCLNTIVLELIRYLEKVVNGVLLIMSFNIEELIEDSDNDLFNKVRNRIHCLSSLLPLLTLLITGLISDHVVTTCHFLVP